MSKATSFLALGVEPWASLSYADSLGAGQLGALPELRTKLAWAVGSTLGLPYSSPSSTVKEWAFRVASTVLEDYFGSQ